MSLNQAAVQDAVLALRQVSAREEASTDPAELETLAQQKDVLIAGIGRLARAELLEAARLVDQMCDAVEACIAAARKGPFHGGYLEDLRRAFDGLSRTLAAMHGTEALPPATPGAAAPPAPQAAAAPLAAAAPKGLPGPANSTDPAVLAPEYVSWFAACTTRPEKQGNLDFYIARLAKGRAQYEKVAAATGVPWFFTGILHGMEGGFDFTAHLHNGDPLSARTVRVPKGRPKLGEPPFAWHDSAIDALRFKRFDQAGDWSLPAILFRFERYNGFGYRPFGVPSPYLWSHSNLYERGKFTSDGVFDANAVSKQTGAAVQLKELARLGLVQLPKPGG